MTQEQDVFGELSRRERQIMDVIYRLGEATAAEVHGEIADPPSRNALRRLIAILEEKGHLTHEWRGPRHVYSPVVPRNRAAKAALSRVRETFFSGSTAEAVAALFDADEQISSGDLEKISALIDKARSEGR